ncbi:hypothetical protein [Chryseobacterium indologenes]|uniref:Uncharacterized protein n=1 Tax=Chryseobacterium indologenes TaxID=253 RepID=A0A0N0ZSP0_CHRID|nr:hypothetical protein [Chryseobacterium indologenes]KPE48990.1 hypothetical protein AOB46_22430 [Chryseobacterium indologenes]
MSNDIISKNKKLYNELYNTNGNIFVIGSSGFTSSYMWSYTNNGISVYNLNNGKVITKKEIKRENLEMNNWLQNPSKDDDGIDKCIAVDGFMLMYKVKIKESFIERRFPLDFECMKKSTYETPFFKKLIDDINHYKIGWREVQ